MKKYNLLLIISLFFTTVTFGQFGFKNKLESVNGVDISYKIVHEKFFDNTSPAQLRLKIKNTNDYDVEINFEIEYNIGLTKSYESGNVNICIPKKAARTGKMHGLVFEINSNDINIFNSDNSEWDFIIFEVKKIENCKLL